MLPEQTKLLFPLLETLCDGGGALAPNRVYDELAERVGLSGEDRRATVPNGAEGRPVNAWERRVRNTRQDAVRRGMIENDPARRKFNLWELTETSKAGLLNCKPGVCVVIYETANGRSVWAEAETAVGLFTDNSIDLIVTSPPYPLVTQKDYGNRAEAAHIDWLVGLFAEWKSKLSETGSLFLNMADTWQKGRPTMSLYQERLIIRLCDEIGLNLCQKLFWENPSKMPSPAEWVTVRRVRLTPSVESLYWLSPSPNPKANNAAVLRPYSDGMLRKIAASGEAAGRRRPSGHVLKAGAFSDDRGGSIPHTLLVAANTSSNDEYTRGCRESGLPVHPARFPEAVPELAIKMLTDPGDLVVDLFGGSARTGKVAERLKRRWAVVEKSLKYACGGVFNFGAEQILNLDRELFDAALA